MRAASVFAFLALLLAVMVLLSSSRAARAQSKTGTTIGQFLLIEPSARVAGMGNAGVTTFSEPMAAYFNPGAMGALAESGVQFTHSRWLADITYNYAVAAIRFLDVNTLLLTVTVLDSGDIAVRTVDQPLGTGQIYSVTNLSFGVGVGRQVTDRFSAGIQAKYIREKIFNSTLSAFALDFGVLYQLPFRAYIGASLSNFGNRGQFDGRDLRIRFDQNPDRFGDNSSLPGALETEDFPLPIFFRVGIGYPVPINDSNNLTFVVDAYHPSDNNESISFGAEWAFNDLFFARAGYQNLFLEDSEAGLTLGAGLQYRVSSFGVQFDYAWNDYGMIGDTQRFTLGFSF